MTDGKVLEFPVDSLEPPPRNSRVEEHLRAAVDHLDKAIEEGGRPMVDAQQDMPQSQPGDTASPGISQQDGTTPVSRAAAGLERVIAALSEELRKAQVKLAAAKIRKEATEVQAIRSAMATLEYRLEKARGFRKQVTNATKYVEQVEKDLEPRA